MVLSDKSKCVGCNALVNTTAGYVCRLAFAIQQETTGGIFHSPKPAEKCYKPMNRADFKEAQRLRTRKQS